MRNAAFSSREVRWGFSRLERETRLRSWSKLGSFDGIVGPPDIYWSYGQNRCWFTLALDFWLLIISARDATKGNGGNRSESALSSLSVSGLLLLSWIKLPMCRPEQASSQASLMHRRMAFETSKVSSADTGLFPPSSVDTFWYRFSRAYPPGIHSLTL